MSAYIDIVYPDCDTTDTGALYLPGEPVTVPDGMTGCAMCGFLVSEVEDVTTGQIVSTGNLSRGEHRGILGFDWDGVGQDVPNVYRDANGHAEYAHLRCMTDAAEQLGSVAITIGQATLTDTGRHHERVA